MTEREKLSERLSAYLDGELEDEEAVRVAQAVHEDTELAEELRRLRAARDLVVGLPRHRAPQDFVERVLAKAERLHLVSSATRQGAPRRLVWVRYLATAAVLLVAASVGVIVAVTLLGTPSAEDRVAGPVGEGGAAAFRESGSPKGGLQKGPIQIADTSYETRKELIRQYREILRDWRQAEAAAKRRLTYDVADLAAGQRTVETLLARNGIEQVRLAFADTGWEESAPISPNFYQTNQEGGRQVHFFVVTSLRQVSQLEVDLDDNMSVGRASPGGPAIYAKSAGAGHRSKMLGDDAGARADGPTTRPAETARPSAGQLGTSARFAKTQGQGKAGQLPIRAAQPKPTPLNGIAQAARCERAEDYLEPLLITLNLRLTEPGSMPATSSKPAAALERSPDGGPTEEDRASVKDGPGRADKADSR